MTFSTELNIKQKKYLRGLAHSLNPLVQVGKNGYTKAMGLEVNRNLEDHELIKVRLSAEDRNEFAQLAQAIADDTKSFLVQTIGRVAIYYRRSQEPSIQIPRFNESSLSRQHL